VAAALFRLVSHRRGHETARLNSGVRRVKSQSRTCTARQLQGASRKPQLKNWQSANRVQHQTASSFLICNKIKVKIYSPQASAEQEQGQHRGHPARLREAGQQSRKGNAQLRARATRLTIRSSRHRFAASAKSRKIVTVPPPQSGAA